MKNRVFALLGVFALSASTMIHAQDYDDIYYGSSSKKSQKVIKVKNNNGLVSTVTPVGAQTTEITTSKYYNDGEFDVDEYNRRGEKYEQNANMFDSDSIYDEESQSTFSKTQRIERFYNPDIIIKSNDDELVELYYDNASNVNIIVGTPSYSPVVVWNDLWYDTWFTWRDPYLWGWHRPYYWYSSWSAGWHDPWYWHHRWDWHDPWRYNWGWNHGWHWNHGWNHHYAYRDYGHHNYRSGYVNSRRPSTNNNYTRQSFNGNRANSRVGNTNYRTGVGNSMNTGRTRPNTEGVMNNRRPASSIGNVGVTHNRVTRDINTQRPSSTMHRSSSSDTYRSTPSSRSYDNSRSSRSYDSGRSYGGSSNSGSFGGSRGGGFSGGHSSSHGGGGGGGRRH